MSPKGAPNLVREASDVTQLLEYLFSAHSHQSAGAMEFPWRGARFAVSRLRNVLRQLEESVESNEAVAVETPVAQPRRVNIPTPGVPKVNAPNIAHRIQRAPTTVGHVRQVSHEQSESATLPGAVIE